MRKLPSDHDVAMLRSCVREADESAASHLPIAWQPFVVPVHPGLPAESEVAS